MLSRTIMPPKTMACFSCILVMQRRRQVSILEESRMFCLLKKLHTFCYCCCCYCLPRAFHNNHWLRSFLVYQSPFFIQCLNCIIWKIYKQNTCKQYIDNRQNYSIVVPEAEEHREVCKLLSLLSHTPMYIVQFIYIRQVKKYGLQGEKFHGGLTNSNICARIL